ncbi:hypothetical protein [sulfur-oxidizing endosymbiont of Gigantopelta aegis]|uniref:hypothetical protein n=1 Tax=sulfur-oxidizing endosymbiont of Gigantopelta aegis TaxID=2794934 RepID=UPI0018DDD010|nr:hypothetical protein [sulfur-oxidizing endosymbiont of Gigantopelta aegis]
MDAITQFLEVGRSLKILKNSPGQIKLRFSLRSLPLMQQLLTLAPFNRITTQQFIDEMKGIEQIQVNQFLARVTIRYDASMWTDRMWDNFCSGKKDEMLIKIISEALESSR